MTKPPGPIKLVVADDEALMRELFAQSLPAHGFEVLTASNGNEAFDLVDHNPVRLIISDINMPVSDGFQLIERLKGSAHKDIPVILMTGDLDRLEEKLSAKKMSGMHILNKPFRRMELVDLIRSVLKL